MLVDSEVVNNDTGVVSVQQSYAVFMTRTPLEQRSEAAQVLSVPRDWYLPANASRRALMTTMHLVRHLVTDLETNIRHRFAQQLRPVPIPPCPPSEMSNALKARHPLVSVAHANLLARPLLHADPKPLQQHSTASEHLVEHPVISIAQLCQHCTIRAKANGQKALNWV